VQNLHVSATLATNCTQREPVEGKANNSKGRSRGHATKLSGSITRTCLQQLRGRNLNVR